MDVLLVLLLSFSAQTQTIERFEMEYYDCKWAEEYPFEIGVNCPGCSGQAKSPIVYLCSGLMNCGKKIKGGTPPYQPTQNPVSAICLSKESGTCPDAQTCLDDNLEHPMIDKLKVNKVGRPSRQILRGRPKPEANQ